MTVRSLILCISLAVVQTQAPVTTPFVGTWALDGFMGAAPFGFRAERAVCGVRPAHVDAEAPDGASVRPNAEQAQYIGSIDGSITVKATAESLTIERRYDGTAGNGSFTGSYALNGSETTSTSGDLTLRAKAAIAGSKLTLTGTTTTGTGPTAVMCFLTETFEVAGRQLQVNATGEVAGYKLTSRQTYLKK